MSYACGPHGWLHGNQRCPQCRDNEEWLGPARASNELGNFVPYAEPPPPPAVAASEDFPRYVWVGFDQDDGEPMSVYETKPAVAHGLQWEMFFPADFYRTELEALRSENVALRRAMRFFQRIYTAGADGERAISCCNGKHFDETLMAGDALYRVSYADAGALVAADREGKV